MMNVKMQKLASLAVVALVALFAAPSASAAPVLFIADDADGNPDIHDGESYAYAGLHRLGYLDAQIRDEGYAVPAGWGTLGAYGLLYTTNDIGSGSMDKYRAGVVSANVPVISSENGMYDNYNWTGSGHGEDGGHTTLDMNPMYAAHPLAAGLAGSPTVYSSNQSLEYARPTANSGVGAAAKVIATYNEGAETRAVIFVYEPGDALPGTNGGFPNVAPSLQIGFFPNDEHEHLTADGWKLVDAAVAYAAGPPAAVPGGPPAGFTGTDIGSGKGWSGFEPVSGTIIVQGDGSDIWGSSDNFHYMHETAMRTGDFNAAVRLISQVETDDWAKAGLMVRESLTGDSRNIIVSGTPRNGVSFAWRDSTGGGSGNSGFSGDPNTTMDGSAPIWLALWRRGNTFYSSWAPDVGGSPGTWSAPNNHTNNNMPATTWFGLHNTSHDTNSLSSALFNNLSTGIWDAYGEIQANSGVLSGKAYGINPVTNTVLAPAHWKITAAVGTSGSGLRTEWFPNQTWTGPPIVANFLSPGVDWSSGNYPAETGWTGNHDNFSVRYTGRLYADHVGDFSFREEVDDEAILWVDLNQNGVFELGLGERLLNNDSWNTHTTTTVGLPAVGWYDIMFETREGGGGDNAKLLWDPDGGSIWSIIPDSVLQAELFGAQLFMGEGWANVGDLLNTDFFGVALPGFKEYLVTLNVDYLGMSYIEQAMLMGSPEPSTMTLLAIGGLALLRRRRRRRAA